MKRKWKKNGKPQSQRMTVARSEAARSRTLTT